MTTIADSWRRDIIDVPLGRTSAALFFANHPEVARDLKTFVLGAVSTAMARRDGQLLEDVFLLESIAGSIVTSNAVLAELLREDWHTQHEDIARTLQMQRDPTTVPALLRAAKHVPPYLAWDENRAFAVKCLHALEDIGTPEAKQALRELAEDPDPVVSTTARRMVARDRPPRAPANA